MIHYLNNAGAGIMSSNTLGAITDHLKKEILLGAYQAAKDSKKLSDQFYESAAKLINASNPNEIAFMDSASRAWNMSLYGAELHKDDYIITLSSEFGTNLLTIFDRAQKTGAKVKVITCEPNGDFDINEIEKLLIHGARMIALSHASAQGSIINPVEEIGKLATKYGALYLVDGCHALGQISVDITKIQCDVYTTTGRKWLCGPRGTGFLYINNSTAFRSPQLDLASADLILDNDMNVIGVDIRKDARQYELWERSIAGMIGFSNAISEYINQDKLQLNIKIKDKANQIREVVTNNPNLKLLGQLISDSGIIGFYFVNPTKEEISLKRFETEGIGISTMSDWDCPLYFPKNGASKIFRLSPHHYTPDSSIHAACKLISEL